MTETDIIRRAVLWARSRQCQILQAIYPGGQGGISVTYSSPIGGSRTIFPDLLFLMGNTPIVGEAKVFYSRTDANKLINLAASEIALSRIRTIFSRHASIEVDCPIFLLAHATVIPPSTPPLFQLVLSSDAIEDAKFLAPAEPPLSSD